MTLEEMEAEITMMRDFDKYMSEHVPGYDMIAQQFAIDTTCKWLDSNGIDSTEFREIYDDSTELM